MRLTQDKDTDKLLRAIERNGGTVRRTNGGHIRVTAPGFGPIFISSTPGKPRTKLNDLQLLKPLLRSLDGASTV